MSGYRGPHVRSKGYLRTEGHSEYCRCEKCLHSDSCQCGECVPPVARVSPGLYQHYAPNSPPYVVIAVSVMDMHGHGNLDAPRIVTYHSTRSFVTGVANSHTEEDFTRPTVWPDGVTRPRFMRIEP